MNLWSEDFYNIRFNQWEAMPQLVLFNRKWSIGSDDFVFAGIADSVIRAIWWVMFLLVWLIVCRFFLCLSQDIFCFLYIAPLWVSLLSLYPLSPWVTFLLFGNRVCEIRVCLLVHIHAKPMFSRYIGISLSVRPSISVIAHNFTLQRSTPYWFKDYLPLNLKEMLNS